ncbi:MAG: class I adenylate-forming enzyme family protein [Rhodospirillales bacterium]
MCSERNAAAGDRTVRALSRPWLPSRIAPAQDKRPTGAGHAGDDCSGGHDRYPDKAALIVGDATLTYAELHRLSHALAGSLAWPRHPRRLDRVAFLLPNGAEIVLCYYACFILGAIAVPLNANFPAAMIGYVLDHSEARVLISEPGLFGGIAAIRPDRRFLEAVYLVGRGDDCGAEDFGELLQAGPVLIGVRAPISRRRYSTPRAPPARRRGSSIPTAASRGPSPTRSPASASARTTRR